MFPGIVFFFEVFEDTQTENNGSLFLCYNCWKHFFNKLNELARKLEKYENSFYKPNDQLQIKWLLNNYETFYIILTNF